MAFTHTGPNSNSLVDLYTKKETEAYESNKAREDEIRGLYSDLINMYAPNSAAEKLGLETIETERRRAVGAGTQNLISSGLFGTTTRSALQTQAQKTATSQRLTLEDILQQRTAKAKIDMASFIERIENPYPDYTALLESVRAQSSAPTSTRIVNSYSGFKSL